MKKIIVSALALIMIFMFAACVETGEDLFDTTQTDAVSTSDTVQTAAVTTSDERTAIAGITADNWTEVLKANFSLDLTLPDGWTVTEAYSPNGTSSVKVVFSAGGTTSGEYMAMVMFAQSQEIGEVDKASFEEAGSIVGEKAWKYAYGDGSVIVDVYYDKTELPEDEWYYDQFGYVIKYTMGNTLEITLDKQ